MFIGTLKQSDGFNILLFWLGCDWGK